MGYDALLASDGDLPRVARMGTGLAETAQRITIRLRTLAGEWVLDTSVGIPYQEWRQVKAGGGQSREDLIRAWGAVLLAEILNTPGVVLVSKWSGSYDVTTRTATYTGHVRTEDGEMSITVTPIPSGTGNRSPHLNILLLQAAPIVGSVV